MTSDAPAVIEVSSKDIPITCPLEKSKWNLHPRVYLPLADNTNEVSCPYCGTLYIVTDLKQTNNKESLSN